MLELTKETCKKWKRTDRTKNPLTNQNLNDRLKKVVSKRCNELLQDSTTSSFSSDDSSFSGYQSSLSSDKSSFSPDTLIKTAEKNIFKHRISPSKSASSSASSSGSRSPSKSASRSPSKSLTKSASRSLSAPNSIEIKDMRENLPFLFELSFHDFEKMQNDNHRIDTVLLNHDIVDPYQVKLVRKFIKYIINIPNAKSKEIKELSEIIQSKKYKKTSFKDLPDDIVKIIGKRYYDIMTSDQLLKWIDEKKLNIEYLSSVQHPGTIKILTKGRNKYKIDWEALSANPAAIELLEQNLDRVNWETLSTNPAAIKILEQNPSYIDWLRLATNKNPNAFRLMHKYPEKVPVDSLVMNINQKEVIKFIETHKNKIYDNISWKGLSLRNDSISMKLLEENQDKIYWVYLSSRSCAIKLLKQNPDKIFWSEFSSNTHPDAIQMLKQNPDKINWWRLSSNPSAIEILEENLDKIHWDRLSLNPCAIKILEQNYDKIDWEYLSTNPHPKAIKLLENNRHKICWDNLYDNDNPAVIKLFEKNKHKIDWKWFCSNAPKSSMKFLEKNQDEIRWKFLSSNPAIFRSYKEEIKFDLLYYLGKKHCQEYHISK